MIYRKLIVLASLLIGFVNIAFAGVGDLDTLNVRSQAPVKERMPVVAYKFNPKKLDSSGLIDNGGSRRHGDRRDE